MTGQSSDKKKGSCVFLSAGKCVKRIYNCFLLTFFTFGLQTHIYSHPAPIAGFEFKKFCLGDTTYFINTTIGGVTYTWNIYEKSFSDTSLISIYTSSDSAIKFLFPHTGIFKIALVADNGHTVSIDRTLFIDSLARANFDYSDCGSQFINLSVCYNSCKWDFGDGSTSFEISPTHFYKKIGLYHVSLTVQSDTKTSTYISTIDISSLNDLTGGFHTTILKDSTLFVSDDTLTGPFTQYHWSFGDDSVANLVRLTGGTRVWHKYAEKETKYTVFLLVKSTCYNAFSSQTILIPDSTPVTKTVLFPNPVRDDILKIMSERKNDITNLSVCDVTGVIVNTYTLREMTMGFELNILDLPAGIYFVNLYLPGEVRRLKLLKL